VSGEQYRRKMLTNIPSGLSGIIATFGSIKDPAFERKNIVFFDLPYPLKYDGATVVRARCHRLVVENFIAAFRNVQAAGLADQFTEFNGIYAKRAIRGSVGRASCHSWGIAIDMCASKYPLGSAKRMPEAIVKVFASAGFFYGGDFKNRKDPMHFQLATNY
jgi:hypothetical protein